MRSLEYPSAPAKQMNERTLSDRDPAAVKRDLRFYAKLTTADVSEAARTWLKRPYWELTVTPGPRVTPKDDAGIDVAPCRMSAAPPPPPPRSALFRDRAARLANGIPVLYAHSGSTTFTQLGLSAEGGTRSEADDQAGTMGMMYSLLSRGFAGMDEARIRERKDLTGITLTAGAGNEDAGISLETPDANLEPALQMTRQMLSQPTGPTIIQRGSPSACAR